MEGGMDRSFRRVLVWDKFLNSHPVGAELSVGPWAGNCCSELCCQWRCSSCDSHSHLPWALCDSIFLLMTWRINQEPRLFNFQNSRKLGTVISVLEDGERYENGPSWTNHLVMPYSRLGQPCRAWSSHGQVLLSFYWPQCSGRLSTFLLLLLHGCTYSGWFLVLHQDEDFCQSSGDTICGQGLLMPARTAKCGIARQSPVRGAWPGRCCASSPFPLICVSKVMLKAHQLEHAMVATPPAGHWGCSIEVREVLRHLSYPKLCPGTPVAQERAVTPCMSPGSRGARSWTCSSTAKMSLPAAQGRRAGLYSSWEAAFFPQEFLSKFKSVTNSQASLEQTF